MKIAVLNTSLERGGAARIARHLNDLYNTSTDVEQSVLFHADSSVKSDIEYGLGVSGSRPVNALLSRLGGASMSYDFGFVQNFCSKTSDFDLLHVHNLHGYYLDFAKLISAWGRDRPIVWTWHDMWGATGRCAFSYECMRWKSGCKSCPHLGYYPAAWIDRADVEFRLKQEVLVSAPNLYIVSPSRWLADIAVARGFNEKAIHIIPNPCEFSENSLPTKSEAKKVLGLSGTSPMILFVASDCGDGRKGYVDFAESTLEAKASFVAVGKKPLNQYSHIQHIGNLSSVDIRSYYRAADLMVIPSYADNFPNTVVESITCGTPVLGYATGGITEQLEAPGCYVVPVGDKSALQVNILSYISQWEKTIVAQDLESQLRSYAESNWQSSVVLKKYVNLFIESLAASNGAGCL